MCAAGFWCAKDAAPAIKHGFLPPVTRWEEWDGCGKYPMPCGFLRCGDATEGTKGTERTEESPLLFGFGAASPLRQKSPDLAIQTGVISG
jgi:hypothetical protein